MPGIASDEDPMVGIPLLLPTLLQHALLHGALNGGGGGIAVPSPGFAGGGGGTTPALLIFANFFFIWLVDNPFTLTLPCLRSSDLMFNTS